MKGRIKKPFSPIETTCKMCGDIYLKTWPNRRYCEKCQNCLRKLGAKEREKLYIAAKLMEEREKENEELTWPVPEAISLHPSFSAYRKLLPPFTTMSLKRHSSRKSDEILS